jgi:hypothetical protein
MVGTGGHHLTEITWIQKDLIFSLGETKSVLQKNEIIVVIRYLDGQGRREWRKA